MLTQAVGLYLATPRQWRFVLLISSVISTAQYCFSPFIVEPPSYLGRTSSVEDQRSAARKLWGSAEGINGKQSRKFIVYHLIRSCSIASRWRRHFPTRPSSGRS